ncbi:MAG: hypothetical protein GY810_28040 [Aureispira sp.]|nr:hypothetical protein [Aureispira sp.]
MKNINRFFFIAATISLILAIVVHVLSLSGVYVEDKVPYVSALHFVTLIVFFFAFFDLRKTPEIWDNELRKDLKMSAYYKLMFKDTPKPILVLMAAIFIYAQVDFFLSFNYGGEGGTADIRDGNYVLHNHGDIIKQLTEKEYIGYQINSLRSYSSTWMIFLVFAVSILWPKQEELKG